MLDVCDVPLAAIRICYDIGWRSVLFCSIVGIEKLSLCRLHTLEEFEKDVGHG
jgi:hypothetical protein